MSNVKLTAVARSHGHTQRLIDGEVQPAGFELEFVEVPVLVQAFRRMVRELEFDVCEMAFSTYLCAREYGVEFTAIPVFPMRGFHHGAIRVNTAAGIQAPKDLEGRRVGVNRGWTVTTGVWARGILARDHGVDLDTIDWVLSGDEHVAAYRPPSNVVPVEPGQSLADLVVSGGVDAVIGVDVDDPAVRPLFASPRDEALRALAERGLYPINHLVVVKNEVLGRYPELPAAVFAAFAAAKHPHVDEVIATPAGTLSGVDRTLADVFAVTGADPMPYGVAPNRAMIDELISLAVDQQIIASTVAIESLFAPGTLDLVG